MTTRPDFAQKLLNDLRQRKERMAASQNSSRQSSQASRGEILLSSEKSQETLDGGSKIVNSERNQPQKDLKMQAVGMEAAPELKPANIVMKKQQNHTNHVNGLTSFKDSTRKQTHGEDKQSKAVEGEGKMLVLNTELQKRAQSSIMLKAEDKTSNRIEQEFRANSLEKRNANNYVAQNQQNVQDQHAVLQEQVPKRPDRSVVDHKPQQLQKQAKIHEAQQVEHINAPKIKRTTAMNLQKKLSRDKSTPGEGRSIKLIEKVPLRDPVNRRHQDAALIIDNLQKTAVYQQSPRLERQSHDSCKTERELQIDIAKGSSNPLLAEAKPIEISATQKRTGTGKVQRREIPVSFLHAGDHENEVSGKKLVLDSANEVMKRKARRHEFTYNPYMKTTISNIKLRSLDDLVRQLCKNLELLKSYGMNGSDECDVAAGLHKMLNKDIYNEDPDVNCMWDFEWSRMMSIFPEMEAVVKDVERHMLNGLLDEITNDLLVITVSA